MLNFFSSLFIMISLHVVFGFFGPSLSQTSGPVDVTYVFILLAKLIISILLYASRGLNTVMVTDLSITAKLSSVWLDTWPRDSPVTMQEHFSFFAIFSAILYISLFEIGR